MVTNLYRSGRARLRILWMERESSRLVELFIQIAKYEPFHQRTEARLTLLSNGCGRLKDFRLRNLTLWVCFTDRFVESLNVQSTGVRGREEGSAPLGHSICGRRYTVGA